jgi:hypothetical protein
MFIFIGPKDHLHLIRQGVTGAIRPGCPRFGRAVKHPARRPRQSRKPPPAAARKTRGIRESLCEMQRNAAHRRAAASPGLAQI